MNLGKKRRERVKKTVQQSGRFFSRELDFGTASQEGYFPYDGPKPLVDTLLKNLVHVGSKPAFVDFLHGEKERNARAKATTNAAHTTYNDSEIH